MDCGESWTCLLRSTGFEGVHCSVTSRWDNGLVAKRHPSLVWSNWMERTRGEAYPLTTCFDLKTNEYPTEMDDHSNHCRHLPGQLQLGSLVWGERPRVTRSDAGRAGYQRCQQSDCWPKHWGVEVETTKHGDTNSLRIFGCPENRVEPKTRGFSMIFLVETTDFGCPHLRPYARTSWSRLFWMKRQLIQVLNLVLHLLWVKQCHKPIPSHHHFRKWYVTTIPSHGWGLFSMVLPTLVRWFSQLVAPSTALVPWRSQWRVPWQATTGTRRVHGNRSESSWCLDRTTFFGG